MKRQSLIWLLVMSALLQDDSFSSMAALSPDGKKVAFALVREGADLSQQDLMFELWLSNADGTQKRRLKSYLGFPQGIQWSPDGRRILTSTGSLIRSRFGDKLYGHAGTPIVRDREWFLSPETGEEARLVLPQDLDAWPVELSPDGTRLAFGARRESEQKYELGVWVFDLKSGQPKKVFDGGIVSAPAWSPDSKRIAFGTGEGYVKDYPIKIVDVQSGETLDLGILGSGIEWSPDGKAIAFTGDVQKGIAWYGGVPMNGSLWIYEFDDKQLKQISHPGEVEQSDKGWKTSGALRPKWSADSNRVAYMYMVSSRAGDETQETEDLWVSNRDGTGLKLVRSGVVVDRMKETIRSFTWDATGQALLVARGEGLFRLDVETSKEQPMASFTQEECKLTPGEHEHTKKALQSLDTMFTQYVKGLDFLEWNNMQDGRASMQGAIAALESVPEQFPQSGISKADVEDYIAEFQKLAEMTKGVNEERVCKGHLGFIGSLLIGFQRDHNGESPEGLKALIEWSLPKSWHINRVTSDNVKLVRWSVHCPSDERPAETVSYRYDKPAKDAPSETVIAACERHKGKLLMLVKVKEGFKVLERKAAMDSRPAIVEPKRRSRP